MMEVLQLKIPFYRYKWLSSSKRNCQTLFGEVKKIIKLKRAISSSGSSMMSHACRNFLEQLPSSCIQSQSNLLSTGYKKNGPRNTTKRTIHPNFLPVPSKKALKAWLWKTMSESIPTSSTPKTWSFLEARHISFTTLVNAWKMELLMDTGNPRESTVKQSMKASFFTVSTKVMADNFRKGAATRVHSPITTGMGTALSSWEAKLSTKACGITTREKTEKDAWATRYLTNILIPFEQTVKWGNQQI